MNGTNRPALQRNASEDLSNLRLQSACTQFTTPVRNGSGWRPSSRWSDSRPTSTFAGFGVNGGQNLNVVGRLLGHSKITTTQRYAHLADDPIRRATEHIGEALAGSMAGQT